MLGTRGQVGIVDLRNGRGIENLPVPLTQVDIGHPVQSLVFVNNLEVCVYCSSGSAFVCRTADLLLDKHRAVQKATVELNDNLRAFAEKLSLPPVRESQFTVSDMIKLTRVNLLRGVAIGDS